MNFINRVLEKFNIKDPKVEEDTYREKLIFSELQKNIEFIETMMGDSFDLIRRQFYLEGKTSKLKVGFVYLSSLTEQTLINETIVENITKNYANLGRDYKNSDELIEAFKNQIVKLTEITIDNKFGQLFNALLSGDIILLMDQVDKFFIISSRNYKERAISTPTVDNDVKGPKDAFTENILTNLSLIRRRIKTPNFWIKRYVIGRDSNTDVCVLYLKGVADEKLITELENRIDIIKPENIISSTYLEHYIKEKQITIFPLFYEIERPDIVVANIFEGRVVILVDGSPFAIILPTTFIQQLTTGEDFYQKAVTGTYYRMLRTLCFYIAIFLPGLYITFVTFHSELIPLNLLIHIAGQRNGVPFPSYMEIFFMSISFDLLREGGIRMPQAFGSALSIVGALIIGQSAVEAGLFSPIIVIIVALTSISGLTIPSYSLNLLTSFLRYIFIILASTFGFYGLTLGLIALYLHMCSLRSFGVSYMAPFAPFSLSGQKDAIFRFPIDSIMKRKKNITDRFPK
ncbi:MAG: spore gernimation protein [Haloplasmataceae bacterium]|nr:spore gernimation protein [Haloplasmataceae bacterium]